ncbi:MAG: hypothetical protein JNM17_26015, partial [Archangium sp.]|nr:hypothetical protein [Archangium sp.]
AKLLRRGSGSKGDAQAAAPVAAPAPDSNADLAAVRPNRTPLIVGLMLVVGLLVGGLVWAFMHESSSGTTAHDAGVVVAKVDLPKPDQPKPDPAPVDPVGAKPAQPPHPGNVKLTLESANERVEVFEDDIMLGTTPFTISRAPGTITALRFESKGFTTQTRKVRFESDTSLRIELVKEKGGGTGTGKKPNKPPPPDDLMDSPF